MARSVLTRPKVALSQDRSAADCSFLGNFHTHAGLLDMVMCEPCVAGTKGVINRKTFTRTSQVLFPAFIGIKEYYDFFKVPIRYLWSFWNDWKVNINDINTSRGSQVDSSGNFTLSLPSAAPRVDFKGLYSIFEQSVPETLSWTTRLNNAMRLLYRCGYVFRSSSDANSNTLNLFKAAAYQKVYYDHYRNTTYESINQFAYNFDWLYAGGIDGSTRNGQLNIAQQADYSVITEILSMHYVNWNNDYFHNIYPSLNYTVSGPTGLDWSIPSNIVNAVSTPSYTQFGVDNFVNSVNGNIGVSKNNYSAGSQGSISLQTLRAAFALDKLMRASAYTPKHVREQFKARFGVDVGDKVSFESERIGSYVSDVSIGEVTQVVNTLGAGQSDLGAVGGKGVGAADFENDLHFYCEEDSLIVGIHYFIPTAMYDKVQDEWSQKLYREDFFQPEFQNLGLRPVVSKNLQHPSTWTLTSGGANNILGYTVPNELYKIGKNENFMMFNKYYSYLKYDSQNNKYQYSSLNVSPLSSFAIHVNERKLLITSLTADYFKVNPSDMDTIFAQAFDGTPSSDQFFGCYRIKFAKVHPMDVHGQPSL